MDDLCLHGTNEARDLQQRAAVIYWIQCMHEMWNDVVRNPELAYCLREVTLFARCHHWFQGILESAQEVQDVHLSAAQIGLRDKVKDSHLLLRAACSTRTADFIRTLAWLSLLKKKFESLAGGALPCETSRSRSAFLSQFI